LEVGAAAVKLGERVGLVVYCLSCGGKMWYFWTTIQKFPATPPGVSWLHFMQWLTH